MNMKQLLIVLAFFSCTSLFCQISLLPPIKFSTKTTSFQPKRFDTIPENLFALNKNGEEEFSEVIDSELLRLKLFSNAQDWIAKTFGDYKSVIQFEDKENGKLILKGHSNIKYVYETNLIESKENINYTITIECKDKKYRYIISDIIVDNHFSILGGRMNKLTLKPAKHIQTIEEVLKLNIALKSKLKSLNKIDKTGLKRKEKEELSKSIVETVTELENQKNLIESENKFYNDELDVMEYIIRSLKKSMSTNDSF